MTIRHTLATGAAVIAVAATSPALAAQEMSYEQQSYEFAQPLPVGDVQPVFTSDPVIQPVPATQNGYRGGYEVEVEPIDYGPEGYPVGYGQPETYAAGATTRTYEVETVAGPVTPQPDDYAYRQPIPAPAAYPTTVHHQQTHTTTHLPATHHAVPHGAPVHHGPAGYAGPAPAYAGPPLPPAGGWDRDSWLDNCESELRRRRDQGAVAGGLLGAVAGGIAGNRIADSERLGGTLLGAGLGGIAGAAIGSAIGSAVRGNPYLRECKRWLENYEDGGYADGGYGGYYPAYGHGQGYGQQGYAYGHQGYHYGYTYAPATAYVTTYPITRPVIREYVTEEWVDVPVEHHVEYETEVHHTPPPPPAPRYIKGKTRYIKGN